MTKALGTPRPGGLRVSPEEQARRRHFSRRMIAVHAADLASEARLQGMMDTARALETAALTATEEAEVPRG